MKPESKRKRIPREKDDHMKLDFVIVLGLMMLPFYYGVKGVISLVKAIFIPTETYVFSDDEKTNT